MTKCVASPRAAIAEHGTCRFHKFLRTPEKGPKSWKSANFPKKEEKKKKRFSWKSQKRQGKKKIYLKFPERRVPAHQPIYKLSITSMIWNISIDQLGLSAWLCSLPAPAHISWIWETGKSPWFHSNNWKHQCYQHSSGTKSKTLQLLGGKLALSQLKPGQQVQ